MFPEMVIIRTQVSTGPSKSSVTLFFWILNVVVNVYFVGFRWINASSIKFDDVDIVSHFCSSMREKVKGDFHNSKWVIWAVIRFDSNRNTVVLLTDFKKGRL